MRRTKGYNPRVVRKRWVFGVAAVTVVVGLVIAWRHEILHAAVERLGSLASGYSIRFADQRVGPSAAALLDVRVSRDGYPLLVARRVEVRYSLRDLLPGSGHRFGLTGIAIEGAKLTLVHFADGSYNLAIPSGGPSAPGLPVPTNTVPIRFALNVRDAQLDLLEPKAYDPTAAHIRIRHFNVNASIDTGARTHYTARGAFLSLSGRTHPFTIGGAIDATRGYAMHHAHAAWFPLRSLANYFADTPSLRILAGRGRNFDARLYALDVRPNEAPAYHANLQLDLDGTALEFASLAEPVENLRGHLELVDNAVFVRGLRGDLAGVPMRITGGLFDLTGQVGPQMRIGIEGGGNLTALRKAFTFTRDQPLAGEIALGVLVEGPLADPEIVARAHAARATYARLPLQPLDANVVYRDGTVALLPLAAGYGGMQIGVRGTFAVGQPHVISQLALHVTSPADRLPYLGALLGSEPLRLDVTARGEDLRFHAVGALASTRGVRRVAALFALEPNGIARVDPFWLHTARGDFDGGYLLDRPHDDSAFWASGYNLRLATPSVAALPGLELPPLPTVSGSLRTLVVAGGGAGRAVALAGDVSGGDTTLAGVHFTSLAATFGGTLAGASVNRLDARGPWGRFHGSGAFSSQTFVARGTYHGTLDGLQPFLGDAIPGHGPIAGTAAIAVENGRILVQGEHLQMAGATLRGIPISSANVTLAVNPNSLQIYSAHAHAAGGDVVAAGSFATGRVGETSAPQLSIVADKLNAAQLRGIGLPIDRGQLSASGNLAAGAPLPTFAGGVTIARGRMQQYAISGNGEVALAGNAVRLSQTIGTLGSTYALVDGSIGALESGVPTYALNARVPAGNIASTLHALGYPNYMTEGSFNAQMRLSGRGNDPEVSGEIGAPGGDVNGLPFVDATGTLAASSRGVSLHHGRVTVGSTKLHLTAVVLPAENVVHVSAQRADLSDFNNFFDTGDTLDGVGRIAFGLRQQGDAIATSGDIDVSGFRYRNLPFGAMRAAWSSRDNTVDGDVAIGGDEGRLTANGTIGIVRGADPLATLKHSRYGLHGAIDDLDLSLWVPALGFASVPITGRASGSASILGRYPALTMRGTARVVGGSLGPLSLNAASVAFHSVEKRIAIDDASLETPGLLAQGSGSFGLLPNDPLDLQIHAQTDDLPRLVHQFARLQIPVTGSFEATVKVAGTPRAPTFAAGFDADHVSAYGLAIDTMFGEVRLRGSTLILSDAGATFGKGQATLAGQLPLELDPFRVGPAHQPIAFDLDVVNLNPAIFDAVLGHGTKMTGTIDGHVGLSGTLAAPRVIGSASLANGSYVSDLERTPITQALGTLAFDRDRAVVRRASARLGAGLLRGAGEVTLPELAGSSGGLGLSLEATAQNAQLDLPAFGSGTLNGQLRLSKGANDPDALVAGRVALSDATLPFAAFVQAAQGGGGTAGLPLPPLRFDLDAVAGKNVRVRGNGYGAGLDIGAAGAVHLGGSLVAPTLAGAFTSTGGTLTYFDRAFRVQSGVVTFAPVDGVIPTIHAVATTNVVNPDPDRARNPYGSAEIRIAVDGPIDGLKIGFSSSPPGYSQQQILGLIAPLGGFVNGIGYNSASNVQVQQLNGVTPLGALAPVPNLSNQQFSTLTVGQEAFNILNAQFAAGLLSPLETVLGQGLGLNSVNLTLGYYGNVGVTATRLLGKTVSAVYSATFGLPQIQTFGVRYNAPGGQTSATLNFFSQSGPTKLFQTPTAYVSGNGQSLIGLPIAGNNGFSVLFQRYFW